MALPTVGGSEGTWGTELNAFLGVSHNASGYLKGAAQVPANYAAADTVWNNTIINASATTWQELDLSSYMGSGAKGLAFLEITANGNGYLALKPYGAGSSTVSNHIAASSVAYGRGTGGVVVWASGGYTYTIVATNESGKIQMASPNTTVKFTIKLLAYVS